jgi:hypothetical protein
MFCFIQHLPFLYNQKLIKKYLSNVAHFLDYKKADDALDHELLVPILPFIELQLIELGDFISLCN